MVLAGARLRLVAVDQHVLRLFTLLRHKRPLHAGGKTGTAAATQAAGLHLIDDPFGTALDRLLRGLVAVQLDVFIDLGRTLAEAAREDTNLVGM